MKYNPRQFECSVTEPFETQTMKNGNIVKLHFMDDEPFCQENLNKGIFSTWASAGGKDYKLFIEKGYYEATKELYSEDVNNVWMDFWEDISTRRRRYLLFWLLPMLIISFLAIILISMYTDKTWIMIVVLVGILVVNMFSSSFLSRGMQKANITAANKVRDTIGTVRFQEILDAEEAYKEEYYKKLQEMYDKLDAEEAERQKELENSEMTEDEEKFNQLQELYEQDEVDEENIDNSNEDKEV